MEINDGQEDVESDAGQDAQIDDQGYECGIHDAHDDHTFAGQLITLNVDSEQHNSDIQHDNCDARESLDTHDQDAHGSLGTHASHDIHDVDDEQGDHDVHDHQDDKDQNAHDEHIHHERIIVIIASSATARRGWAGIPQSTARMGHDWECHLEKQQREHHVLQRQDMTTTSSTATAISHRFLLGLGRRCGGRLCYLGVNDVARCCTAGPRRGSASEERPRRAREAKVAKRQWLAERMELERQLEDARRGAESLAMQASREKATLVDSERALREQMKILKERLETSVAESRRHAQADTGASASAELSSLRDAVMSMMTEVRGAGMEKRQLELKAEHEKQLIGLERKFQRQLMEARRKNESLIQNLQQTYEDEVEELKSHRSDIIGRSKDLERELERARGEAEVLRQKLHAAESEQALQKRFVENAQRQRGARPCPPPPPGWEAPGARRAARAAPRWGPHCGRVGSPTRSPRPASHPRGCPGRGGKELQGVREELSALTGAVDTSPAKRPGGAPPKALEGSARGDGVAKFPGTFGCRAGIAGV
ncbi:unnamed protein product [Prorocentrum cordatum]|uniref:Centrosomal protein of 162 kDa n=1 Tax=Prorocentrum cordatum TaxID=2364126 RepID=A0ABN9QXN5_9DINO|nr:unnamed protein product [Polarella glacialis]